MKSQLIAIVAAVLVVGCSTTQSLHRSAQFGNIEAVKQHLDAGGDVNAKNRLGNTALHFAAWEGRKEIVELLIAKGADVNAKNRLGNTALHYAAYEVHKEIVELLIAKGADVNAKSDIHGTPLDLAIGGKHPETADLLRKHGGKATVVDTIADDRTSAERIGVGAAIIDGLIYKSVLDDWQALKGVLP